MTAEVFIFAIVAAALGCTLSFLLARRIFKRALAELRDETGRQLSVMAATIRDLESRLAEVKNVSTRPVSATTASPAAQKALEKKEEVSSDILVMLAAAVTTFLGKKVRIHSARMLQSPYEIVNPWAQQGRVFVQASHNLRERN